MSFSLPTFNLTVRLWRWGHSVATPPDLVFAANLAYGRRVHEDTLTLSAGPAARTPDIRALTAWMTLLCPGGTDVRPFNNNPPASYGDCVEVPAFSGRYYFVALVEDSGKGFPNEHRVATITLLTPPYVSLTGNTWLCPPTPYPLP